MSPKRWSHALATTPPWQALPAHITSTQGARSAAAYADVLGQFCVGSCRRYAPTKMATYCNIFVWDVTRAMGCEIPHWIDADKRGCEPGDAGARETTANYLAGWLEDVGRAQGWEQHTRRMCASLAALGFPTVASLQSHGRHGHIAMVSPDGTLAQAGERCGTGLLVADVLGWCINDVTWWGHP